MTTLRQKEVRAYIWSTLTTYATVLSGPVHHRLVMSRVLGERKCRTCEVKLLLVRNRGILPALGSESGPSLCAPRTTSPTGHIPVLVFRHITNFISPIVCVILGYIAEKGGGHAWRHFRLGKFLVTAWGAFMQRTWDISPKPWLYFGRTFFARGQFCIVVPFVSGGDRPLGKSKKLFSCCLSKICQIQRREFPGKCCGNERQLARRNAPYLRFCSAQDGS